MPPSWLLEAVAETQESNGRASASANASNPASKQSTSSRQPEQRIEIPSHRSIPAIRERAEFTSVNQNWSKDLAPNSMNTPMSGSHGHGDSGAGGFDLFKNDVYPDLNEFDRMFSENRSLDMPSATSVSPSLSPGATMETSQRLGADGNIDGAGSDRPPFGLQISEPEKLALRQHLKDQRAPENLGEQLRPLSPGASSSLAADANTTGYCYHGKRSIDLDEAQKTDDPKLLWAIIHSLLESKMKAKQPESNQKMPQLIDMTSMTCKVCGAPTPRLCAGCHLLSYCASEHQAKVRNFMFKYISSILKCLFAAGLAKTCRGMSRLGKIRHRFGDIGGKPGRCASSRKRP